MSDLRTLADQSQAIHDRYRRDFAGKSRITRDVAVLDGLISELEVIHGQADGLDGAKESLMPTVAGWLTLYRTERESIAKAQEGGESEVVAHRISDWDWLNYRRYARHFAGQARPTRDLGLLTEMMVEQRRIRDELARVAAKQAPDWRSTLRAQVERNLELYTSESDTIAAARRELPPERRAQVLATAANAQFSLWRDNFASRARRTRRLALLQRMIGQLEQILGDMVEVRDAGIRTEAHLGNIDKVADRLALYRKELGLIEQAIGAAGGDTIAAALGTEANEQFSAYRSAFAGKSRRDVSLSALGGICDRLQEVTRNMDTLDRTWGHSLNAKNLQVVLENLKRYEREWIEIKKVQSS